MEACPRSGPGRTHADYAADDCNSSSQDRATQEYGKQQHGREKGASTANTASKAITRSAAVTASTMSTSWAALEASRSPLGGLLEASWSPLGPSLGSQKRPGSSQNRPKSAQAIPKSSQRVLRAPCRSLEGTWRAPGSPSAVVSKESEGSLMQTLFRPVQFSCSKQHWDKRFSPIGFRPDRFTA